MARRKSRRAAWAAIPLSLVLILGACETTPDDSTIPGGDLTTSTTVPGGADTSIPGDTSTTTTGG